MWKDVIRLYTHSTPFLTRDLDIGMAWASGKPQNYDVLLSPLPTELLLALSHPGIMWSNRFHICLALDDSTLQVAPGFIRSTGRKDRMLFHLSMRRTTTTCPAPPTTPSLINNLPKSGQVPPISLSKWTGAHRSTWCIKIIPKINWPKNTNLTNTVTVVGMTVPACCQCVHHGRDRQRTSHCPQGFSYSWVSLLNMAHSNRCPFVQSFLHPDSFLCLVILHASVQRLTSTAVCPFPGSYAVGDEEVDGEGDTTGSYDSSESWSSTHSVRSKMAPGTPVIQQKETEAKMLAAPHIFKEFLTGNGIGAGAGAPALAPAPSELPIQAGLSLEHSDSVARYNWPRI